MSSILLKDEYRNMLFDIFDSYCPKAEIWVYGSRINGNAHEGSDLDLVVKSFNDEKKSLSELKELISNSNIPFLVDINEYTSLPQNFCSEIDKKYLVFYKK